MSKCKKIFIAATGQHCGKTTISLSLMHLARKKYPRVGFIKPIGPKCIEYNGMVMDIDAVLMSSVYKLDAYAHLMSPMTLSSQSTRRFLDGEIPVDYPRQAILKAVEALEKEHDFLIIEGAGHAGVGSVIGMNNADVAALTGASVLLVTGGGIGSVIDSAELNLALYREAGVDVRFIMLNKLVAEKRDCSISYMKKAFAKTDKLILTGFDYSPILANPTLKHVSDMLKLPLMGDQNESSRICHFIHLGAASSQRVIDILQDSTLLIVTSSRDELVVTASSLHHIPDFKQRLAGLVICGHSPMSKITRQILEDSNIPYIRVEANSADILYRLRDHVSKIGPEDQEKIDLIRSNAESCIDFEAIDSRL